jgi:hypothetical protein
MGITGDDQRLDAAIISDTVNAASRIESLSKHYGVSILLSEDSINNLEQPDNYNLRFLGRVKVKGKNNPIGIYECFDGDLPEISKLKKETLSDFDDGIGLYFNKEFAQAAMLFQQVITRNPQDVTTRLFLQKAGQYLATGAPDNWDGVEVMTGK